MRHLSLFWKVVSFHLGVAGHQGITKLQDVLSGHEGQQCAVADSTIGSPLSQLVTSLNKFVATNSITDEQWQKWLSDSNAQSIMDFANECASGLQQAAEHVAQESARNIIDGCQQVQGACDKYLVRTNLPCERPSLQRRVIDGTTKWFMETHATRVDRLKSVMFNAAMQAKDVAKYAMEHPGAVVVVSVGLVALVHMIEADSHAHVPPGPHREDSAVAPPSLHREGSAWQGEAEAEAHVAYFQKQGLRFWLVSFVSKRRDHYSFTLDPQGSFFVDVDVWLAKVEAAVSPESEVRMPGRRIYVGRTDGESERFEVPWDSAKGMASVIMKLNGLGEPEA